MIKKILEYNNVEVKLDSPKVFQKLHQVSIVVVTKKNINNRKAMSAIDPCLAR